MAQPSEARRNELHKPAPADHTIHDFIRFRWSPRAFSDQPVPSEVLQSLFEAARWTPSSSNEQPWAFLVGTKDEPECHAKVLNTLEDSNQVWAKHAPVLGVVVSELQFARTGHPNRNALYDTGAAMAYLTVEATSRGLFVHQMAGFHPQKARELLRIPEGWEPIAAFALGYYGNLQALPEKLREREAGPRNRKPISEFVMSGTWGQRAPFLSK